MRLHVFQRWLRTYTIHLRGYCIFISSKPVKQILHHYDHHFQGYYFLIPNIYLTLESLFQCLSHLYLWDKSLYCRTKYCNHLHQVRTSWQHLSHRYRYHRANFIVLLFIISIIPFVRDPFVHSLWSFAFVAVRFAVMRASWIETCHRLLRMTCRLLVSALHPLLNPYMSWVLNYSTLF